MKKTKLYELTSPTYELPHYVDKDRRVRNARAQDIPMLKWPDGRWCFPANIYMLDLYRKGRSRFDGGGTLLTYATNISHLLRYCQSNEFDLQDLTDNQFTFFIRTITGERSNKDPERPARGTNTVITIGRNCLDFLSCVGRVYGNNDLVGPEGQIRAERKKFVVRTEGQVASKNIISGSYWHHHSLPASEPLKRRLPISSKNISKLRESVMEVSTSIYLRKRRYVMLKLLEVTGGRRSEVAALTIESVRNAAKMSVPMLKLQTLKKRTGKPEYRYIPISTHDLAFLIEFIDANRARIIRRTCGKDKDDGRVLVSETSGLGLRPNTITQEVSLLAKVANIREQTCPQMFRHRFITKLFVALIEQHKFENADDFRRALLDTEKFKREVQQWTGHTLLSSLDPYIHLAFDEITGFSKTLDIVRGRQLIESFKGSLDQFKLEFQAETVAMGVCERLTKLVEKFDNDLQNLTH